MAMITAASEQRYLRGEKAERKEGRKSPSPWRWLSHQLPPLHCKHQCSSWAQPQAQTHGSHSIHDKPWKPWRSWASPTPTSFPSGSVLTLRPTKRPVALRPFATTVPCACHTHFSDLYGAHPLSPITQMSFECHPPPQKGFFDHPVKITTSFSISYPTLNFSLSVGWLLGMWTCSNSLSSPDLNGQDGTICLIHGCIHMA